jgi:hypothetical protein
MGSCTDVEYITVDVDPVVDFGLTTGRYSICSNGTGISLLYSGGSNPSELEYSIIFSDEARGTGFQNISAYTGVPAGGSINVPIPANALAGTYSGTLYVRYIANPACVREYTFQVNIVAQPVLTPVSSFTYCHGTAVPVLQLTSNVSNASIEWERVLTSDAIQGLPDNGRNSIPQFMANNDGTSTITADYKYRITTTDGISSCSDSSTFSISIIPVQIVDAIDEIELCTGDTLNLHFTGTAGQYSWSRESGSSTLGLPQSGTGDIIDVELINTTTNIISAAYKVIPKSGTGTCIGSEERFTLTVYPDPVLDNITETVICSGDTFSYTARSSTDGIVYSWERLPNPGLNGGAVSSGSNGEIMEVLVNTTNARIEAEYVITLDQNGVCSKAVSHYVKVDPVPSVTMTRTLYPVCHEETEISLEYVLGSSYGMNYSVEFSEEAVNAGFASISGTLGSTLTVGIPSNPIAGSYAGVLKVLYDGTTGCVKELPFTVIVNSQLVIYPVSLPPAYCSGTIVPEISIPTNMTSSVARVEWRLLNGVQTGLPVNSGYNAIPSFRAVNTGGVPVTAEFELLLTCRNAGITCELRDTISITIDPTPSVSPLSDQYICNTGALDLIFTGSSAHEYRWTKTEGGTISIIPSSGTGDMHYAGLENNTSAPVSATYQVVPVSQSGMCVGSAESFRITLYPTASLSSTLTPPDICCMGTFEYNSTTAIQGVDFSWERLPATGITGSSTGSGWGSYINETLTNNTSPRTHVDVSYVISMSQNNSTCVDTDTVTVRVNPAARLSFDSYVQTICQGVTGVSYSLGFESGVNYGDVRYSVIFSGQSRLAGFSDISSATFTSPEIQISVPSNVYSGDYTATVVSWFDGYEGCTREYTIEIKVVGQPVIMPLDESYHCSEETVLSRNFYGNMTSDVIFEWRLLPGSDAIPGLSASGTGPMPQFTASNITRTMLEASYQVVMLHFGEGLICSDTATFDIRIEPEQRVDAVENLELCSGSTLSVSFSGAADEYFWRRTGGSSALGLPNSRVGNISYSVSNSTSSILRSTYIVTARSTSGRGECVGNSEEFTVTVYPVPSLNSGLDAGAICSGERFSYSATSAVSEVDFSWTRAPHPGINSGQSGSGNSGVISETLVNSTSASIEAVYTVSLSVGNGCSYTENVTVTVNPVADFRLDNPLYTVCMGTSEIEMSYTAANDPGDLEYSVEFSHSALGAGFQNVGYTAVSSPAIVLGIPVNTMPGSYTGTITVRFSAYPSCHTGYSFVVTVSEQPQVNFVPGVEFCNGEATTPVIFSGNTTNAVYYWSHESGDAVPNLNLNGYGNIPSFLASNTGNSVLTGTYRVRMTNIANSSCYDESVFNISVLPTPGIDYVEDAHVCSGDPLDIQFTGTGTGYTWQKVSGSSIPGLTAQGSGDIYIGSVSNSAVQIISAVYKVTASLSICTGLSDEFSISIYPTPVLSSNADGGTICSGEKFVYTAETLTENVLITWVRPSSPSINGGVPGSGNNEYVSENLVNRSDAPVSVDYIFTISQGPCSVERTVTVTVNPVPEIEFQYMNYVCSNAGEVTVPYTTRQSAAMEYILTFTREANNSGFINVDSYTALSGALSIQFPPHVPSGIYNATITVRTYGCTGSYPVAIHVHKPVTIVEHPESFLNVCESVFDLHFEVTATGDSLEYQWYHNGVAISGATGSSYSTTYYRGLEGKYHVEVSNMCETVTSSTAEVKASEILVDLKWDDVLYINNLRDEYVEYQWYKDGIAISSGGTSQYYTDVNGLDGYYHAVCTYADGTTVSSCPKEFHTAGTRSASLYPNPAERGGEVKVELGGEEESGEMVIVIYDASGKAVCEYKSTGTAPVIRAPYSPGSYNIHIYRDNASKSTVAIKRLIVK